MEDSLDDYIKIISNTKEGSKMQLQKKIRLIIVFMIIDGY